MYMRYLLPGILVAALLMAQQLKAQVYRRSFGVRLDETSVGISLVQRIAKPVTVEAIADFRQRDFSVALVPRVHGKLIGRRLNYFVGAGAHAGWVKIDSRRLQSFWGAGGMIGLEYKFHLLPIHISYDIRPLVQLDGHPDLFGFQSAFTIRIVKKAEKSVWKEKLKKWREDVFGEEDD
jgi:hypothetical protein